MPSIWLRLRMHFGANELRWQDKYPREVASIREDLGHLLAFYRCEPLHWEYVRTSNPIERVFREPRRQQFGCGAFSPTGMPATGQYSGSLPGQTKYVKTITSGSPNCERKRISRSQRLPSKKSNTSDERKSQNQFTHFRSSNRIGQIACSILSYCATI